MTKRNYANLSNLAMRFMVLMGISWIFPGASMKNIILPLLGFGTVSVGVDCPHSRRDAVLKQAQMQ